MTQIGVTFGERAAKLTQIINGKCCGYGCVVRTQPIVNLTLGAHQRWFGIPQRAIEIKSDRPYPFGAVICHRELVCNGIHP